MKQRAIAAIVLVCTLAAGATVLSLLPANANHACVSASVTMTTPVAFGKYVETCAPLPSEPMPFQFDDCVDVPPVGGRICATASAHIP